MEEIPEPITDAMEQKLMGMSASLLGLVMKIGKDLSPDDDVMSAETLHDNLKLYPRLTITCPHGGGGGVRVELALCHPETDEPVVGIYQATALAVNPSIN